MDRPTLLVDTKQALLNLKHLSSFVPNTCKIRLSSKSIRSPELLKLFLRELGERGRGVMCFHPDEISFLLEQGINDILLAYPYYTPSICERLARLQKDLSVGQAFFLMADLEEHLQMLSLAAAEQSTKFNVLVDLDVSTRYPGLHFGVHRSSIQDARQLEAFAQKVHTDPNLNLSGLMTYEAQIAGVADRDPRESSAVAFVKRQLKSKSLSKITERRQEAARVLETYGPLEVLNGGGSGSVQSTVLDPAVNEVTLGSGLLCPALFENYQGLNISPAIAYALPVIRRPEADIATAYAGGYIASGSHSRSKQPRILFPPGWDVTENEGFGEVQTPLKKTDASAPDLALGQLCYAVPAKSGEVMERFEGLVEAELNQIPPVIHGKTFKTYRGHGVCFA